ncbi:DUF2637 domain-containing protein [Streptomyces sp. NPDC058872]|uniref:DUF2637 domain-containing protein n=1 Tax=Streptomyces sp. NPDC058872 TaxID=3346661 RepID=UPI0036C06D29
MNRIVWWASLLVIGAAAAGMTGWSLYVVAHDLYGVPHYLALLTAAVFDGAAMACLYLASAATNEGRSAAGPRLAVFALAAVSVSLNAKHADHINGGVPALLLFAAPTAALLIVADLAWAATRARKRAAAGDRPVTLPRYGLWGWILAGEQAWAATRARAVNHVTSTDAIRTESEPRLEHSATAKLRAHFENMDPDEAIRLAHSAKPTTPPAELAAELVSYGVHVSAVQVALVLGYQPPKVWVERPTPTGSGPESALPPGGEKPLTGPDPDPNQSGPTPVTVLDATKLVAQRGIYDEVDATAEVSRLLGRPVRQDTVRRYLNDIPEPKPEPNPTPEVGQGGGGYN